nr:DUF2812 domain-containing protein [uncultured Bacillus sp.]
MTKKFFRYFGGFLSTQEKWLNAMSAKGYRLIKVRKFVYEFEVAEKNQYQYRIEFVAHLSNNCNKEYRDFLNDLGYTIFTKNFNVNYSIGKIRWRPYGKGMGQISNPGNFNKELLIVEKKNDDKPFELHSTFSDRAEYCKPIRNMWLALSILFITFAIWTYFKTGIFSVETLGFSAIGAILLFPTVLYQKYIMKCTLAAEIEEM